jgi:hypothetical protein
MKKFLKDLINDNNSINEKALVGFIAVFCMIIALLTDLLTGYFGKPLVINEFIFDGFLMLAGGAFGIATIDKYINRKHKVDSEEPTEE